MKLFSFDTEDDSRGNPLLVNFYDGSRHYTFIDTKEAWQFIVNQEPAQVWACNLEYDLLNLFREWTANVLTLQYVSSGLMRASMAEANITFYDTMRHSNPPVSVEMMGKLIGKPKMKDYLSDHVNKKLIEACQRDTEIVYDYMRIRLALYEGLNLKLKSTLPSMALQLWHQFNKKDFPRVPQKFRDMFREGYYGGRVEVFKFGEIKGPIYHYDINSLYPHVMRKHDYPDLETLKKIKTPDFENFGMAKIIIDIPKTKFPCLPYRSDKEILFPIGKIEGVYCYPEIRQALKDGGKISNIEWAIESNKGLRPFESYINYCYGNRLKATNKIDGDFWKMMMNSLYGKFGAKDEMLTISKDKEFILTSASRWSNVIWAAYVTTYARLELLNHLRTADIVYYTDTDSIFTPNIIPVSKELGDLKQEGVYSQAEFFGNKVYVVDEKYKARGVPRKKDGDENDPAKDFIRSGRCIFRRPARLRESRRTSNQANVWYHAEKHFKARYTKRIIRKNGDTFPLTIEHHQRIIN
jgi:hypothetical protein